MIKIAVIGIGMMGQTHAKAITTSNKNIRLSAICGADIESDREKASVFDCPFFTNIDEMLKCADIDIIDICTPTFTHEETITRAADAGKNVMCEKPLSLTYESAQRIINYCEEKNVKLMTAQVVRFMAAYEVLADYITSGRLGNVRLGFMRRMTSRAGRVIRNAGWYDDPAKSGGALFDLFIHDLDFIYSVLGKPKDVFASGIKSPSGCWDEIEVDLRYASGAVIAIESCSYMPTNYPFTVGFRINGDLGCLEYNAGSAVNSGTSMDSTVLNYYSAAGKVEQIGIEKQNDYQKEIEYFCGCVEKNEKPVKVPPEQSAEVIGIVMSIMKSLDEHNVVSL